MSSIEHADHLAAYDAIVIGSAVYYGSWMTEAMEYVRHNRLALALRPIWLFSSGPLGDHLLESESQPKELAELKALLHPRDHHIFFGALDNSKLSFAERVGVKSARSHDGDYRQWREIEAWAEQIGAAVSHVGARTRSAQIPTNPCELHRTCVVTSA